MLPYYKYLNLSKDDSLEGNYIIPLYSVPLIHLQLNDWENRKKILIDAYNERKKYFKTSGNLNSSVDTDFHYNFSNIDFSITDLIFNNFQDELITIGDIFECELEVNNSWFENSKQNTFHPVHNHGLNSLSCVIFINFDPLHHSPTVFINPLLASYGPISPTNVMPPGIREGSMIIFPSYLYHYTVPNQSNIERTILSFNIHLKQPTPDQIVFDDKNSEYSVSNSDV